MLGEYCHWSQMIHSCRAGKPTLHGGCVYQACLLELKPTSGKTAKLGMLRTLYCAASCGNRSVSTFNTTARPARSRAV